MKKYFGIVLLILFLGSCCNKSEPTMFHKGDVVHVLGQNIDMTVYWCGSNGVWVYYTDNQGVVHQQNFDTDDLFKK